MAITQQEATSPTAGNVAELNHLLGGEAPVEETPSPEVEAENSEVETETEESTQSDDTPTEEVAEEPTEEESSGETEEEESEPSLDDETDHDYSESAYQKFAKHFDLDPNNPRERRALKEIMDRGRDFAKLKAQQAEAEAKAVKKVEETIPEPAADKTQQQPAARPTPEQIKEFTTNAFAVAKSRIIPEVAMAWAQEKLLSDQMAMWPHLFNDDGTLSEKAIEEGYSLPKISQARAIRMAEANSAGFWMQLEDALPVLRQDIGNAISSEPVFSHVRQETIRASALEQLDEMTDKTTGKKLYADLDEMVDSGALRKVLKENPQLENLVAGNGRDPVANQVLRYQTAFKIARGEQVNLPSLQKAVDTGKKQAETRAKKIASGRVSSGTPKGGFGKGPSADQQLVSGLVSGSESKFGAAVRQARKLR